MLSQAATWELTLVLSSLSSEDFQLLCHRGSNLVIISRCVVFMMSYFVSKFIFLFLGDLAFMNTSVSSVVGILLYILL